MNDDPTRKQQARERIEKRRQNTARRATVTLPARFSATPRIAKAKRVWVREHEALNTCLVALGEKIGRPMAPVTMPGGRHASINDRLEDRLTELGVPARLHTSAMQALAQQHVAPLASIRMEALYEDPGSDEALDPEEVDPFHMERVLNLYFLCRLLGVEVTLDEAWETSVEIWEWMYPESGD